MRILIVEDDQWLADCYRQWLERAGYDTVWRNNAQDALDALDEQTPQLLLLDIMLPSANGIQLLQELRTHADSLHVPVIVCSSALSPGLPDLSAYNVVRLLDKTTLTPSKLRKAVQGAVCADI